MQPHTQAMSDLIDRIDMPAQDRAKLKSTAARTEAFADGVAEGFDIVFSLWNKLSKRSTDRLTEPQRR